MKVSRKIVELIFMLETLALGIGGFILCYQPGYFDLMKFVIGGILIFAGMYNVHLYCIYLGSEYSQCDYFRIGNKIEDDEDEE